MRSLTMYLAGVELHPLQHKCGGGPFGVLVGWRGAIFEKQGRIQRGLVTRNRLTLAVSLP